MLETIRRDWRGVLFQSLATAFAFILLLLVAASIFPNSEEVVLEDIREATRAQVCVLALPVDENGRDPEAVDRCLTENNLPPLSGGSLEGP